MTPRKKVSRSKRPNNRRTKSLLPEWDSLDTENRAFFGSFEEDNPEWTLGTSTPDLHHVAEAMAIEKRELLKKYLRLPYNSLIMLPGGAQYIPNNPRDLKADLPDWAWLIISDEIRSALLAGFYFAVLRYADELRQVPEVKEFIEKRINAAHKGGEAKRTRAEPRHKQIRKRFRELRKTSPKKGVRYLRLASEFDLSDRQIARIVAGID